MAISDLAWSRLWSSRRFWWGLVITSLLLASAFISWRWIALSKAARLRLEAAIAVAERDDPNWRLDDLLARRERVPDEENSAIVVAKAVALLPKGWPKGPSPEPGDQQQHLPAKLGQVFDRIGQTPANQQLDDDAIGLLRKELETYEESARIGRGVADYERGHHELKLGPSFAKTLLKETESARALARLLAADAEIRAHDGDADGALESCRAILGVGRSIGDEPFFISQLVRISMGSAAMKSASRAIGQGEPSDEALARLQAAILKEMEAPRLLETLRGERAGMYEDLRRIGSGEIPFEPFLDLDAGEVDAMSPLRLYLLPWAQFQRDDQLACLLEWMNAAVAAAQARGPERLVRWDAWSRDLNQQGFRRPDRGLMFPLLFFPPLLPAEPAQIRYESELGAMAILLAAERHRRKVGDWPASISAIDREILPDPPLDPCSGKPFLMERRDGQFIAYSVGPNGLDDHGAFDPKQPPNRERLVRSLTKKREEEDRNRHHWLIYDSDDPNARAWDVPLRRQEPAAPKPAEGEAEATEGEMEGARPGNGPAPPEMP